MNTDFELRLPFVDFAMSGNGFDALLDLQRQQWDALLRWQAFWVGLQRDAFDQWVSHWGGGVPIDG